MKIEICDRCMGTPVVPQSTLPEDLCDECLQSFREWRNAPRKAREAEGQRQVGTARIFRDLGESGYEKDIARQLSKLKLKKGSFLDALGSYREGLEDGEEATGTQKMARKLFRLFGRLSGSAPIEEDEEEGDVIDVLPEPDRE